MNHLETCVKKLGQVDLYEPSEIEDQLKQQKVKTEDLKRVMERTYYALGTLADELYEGTCDTQGAMDALADILDTILGPHI